MVGAGRQAIVGSCEILCIPARAGASRGRKCCRDWQGHCAPEWTSPRWQGAPRTQTESLDPGEKAWLGMVLQASPSSTPTTTPLVHTPHRRPLEPEQNTTRPLNSATPFHCAHKNTHIFMSGVESRGEGRGLGAAQSVCELTNGECVSERDLWEWQCYREGVNPTMQNPSNASYAEQDRKKTQIDFWPFPRCSRVSLLHEWKLNDVISLMCRGQIGNCAAAFVLQSSFCHRTIRQTH